MYKIQPKGWDIDECYFIANKKISYLSNGKFNIRYVVDKRVTPSRLYADNFVKISQSMKGVEYTANEINIL
jgi:hypothetical protein